jgi:hypothetical protein
MYKSIKSDKDTYITNKYVAGVQSVSGNVGIAGSLDLFKLYGITNITSGSTKLPQTELSRLLIHFDIDQIKDLISSGKIDITDSSFKCYLSLKDVYGGQPTPSNFTLEVYPLSASFIEGFGKDSSYYSDKDSSNFLSSSYGVPWNGEGCSVPCFSTGSGDYITSSLTIATSSASQYFKTGEEDLLVDVTKIISATVINDLPDQGFRISFSQQQENDTNTYFVKRFGSRQCYDETKQPELIVKFDDSIEDDSSNFFIEKQANIFLYSYNDYLPDNLLSGSTSLTGSNCLKLELQTEVSGIGKYSLEFSESQYLRGQNYLTGVYQSYVSASLFDVNLKQVFDLTGSIIFTPIWKSLDGTIAFATGSKITANSPQRTSTRFSKKNFNVSTILLNDEFKLNQLINVRVNIFEGDDPSVIAKRLPITNLSKIVKNAYYAVRDIASNVYVIPFDNVDNSTKISSDYEGMYFNFDTSPLVKGKNYVFDIMLMLDNVEKKYLDSSNHFRIT